MTRLLQLFPVWALLVSSMAYLQPTLLIDLKVAIMPLLMVIMLTMGLTLGAADFYRVVRLKKWLAIGVLLQFTVMPISAWLIARTLGFDSDLTVGLLLVGSVAGGTASNVMCYLAKGDVALSITMTAVSTLLSVVLTPVIVFLLADQQLTIPVGAIMGSLVQVIVIPVALGFCVNVFLPRISERLQPVLPVLSMAIILLVIAIVVALNAANLAAVNSAVVWAVILHNSIGLIVGYGVVFYLGASERYCRTIAFEVGLQNSGLAAALAIKYFSAAAALPSVVFSVWHNVSGALLAGYWAKKVPK